MSQPQRVPVEKSFQQHLNDAFQFVEKTYGLDAQKLAIALVVILITIGGFAIRWFDRKECHRITGSDLPFFFFASTYRQQSS